MKTPRKFKDGGVSQCWHCGNQLVRVRGGFLHSLIQDPDGNKMRVHKGCVPDAVGHGYVEVKEAAK